MRKTVRLTAFVSAVFMLVSLAACKPGTENEITTAEGTPPVTEAVPADFSVVRGGASEFVVVRPDSGDSTEVDAAKLLRDGIEEKTGCRIPMTIDWYIKADPAAQYEIIVGHADREESRAVNAEIDAEDGFFYVIRAVGDKIIVSGKSAAMIKKAVEFMLENYVDGEGNMTVPKDINIKSELFTPSVAEYFAAGKETVITTKKLGEIAREGKYKIIQGGTSDGRYLYVILNDGGKDNTSESMMIKIEISTMKTVAKKEGLRVCHGNDIAYKRAENELYVVHCYPNGDTVSVFDADTLKYKRKIKLPVSIFCMSYDETLDCFWVGINGGDTFAKLTSDFKFVKRYMSQMHSYVTQGMDCDDKYLYFVRYKKNCVIVYDKKGKFIGEYDLAFSGEPENISHVGDTFYITGNGMISKGGLIYRVEVAGD